MIDVDQKTIHLRQMGVTQGVRPVIIKVMKGDYPYKGNYVLSSGDEYIYFSHLNFRYNYKKRRAVDFKIAYSSLEGYRFAFEKSCYKRITLIFKDGLEFSFKFICDCQEA
jgi:hypothetical protein